MSIKSIYIASLEKSAGSLIVSIGMMEILKRKYEKVGIFRPVVISSESDSDIELISKNFSLDLDFSQSYGFTLDESLKMISENRFDEFLETLIDKYKKLEQKYDFILCEGLSRSYFSSTIEFDINLAIAKNFSSHYVSILNAKSKKSRDIFEEIKIEAETIQRDSCSHLCTIVNRCESSILEDLKAECKSESVFFIPEERELEYPTISEVKEILKATQIYGSEDDLKRVVRDTKILTQSAKSYLESLKDGDLILTSADRVEDIVMLLSANYSKEFPSLAGILLTENSNLDNSFLKLISTLNEFSLPILELSKDTFSTSIEISKIEPSIVDDRKIALSMGIFSKAIDMKLIERKLQSVDSEVMTPMMFQYNLFEMARSSKRRIVLPESEDDRVLRAVEILLRRDVADITLLGERAEIERKASALGIDIQRADIVNPEESTLIDEFAKEFYKLRSHKGVLLSEAKESMFDYTYFATMMVHLNYADGMVSGAIHTTKDTIKPALQIIKTKPNISIVSSIFFMCLDSRVLVYGDCAVNPEPNEKQLAEIAISSAKTAQIFEIEPRVAMLSYSTGSSGAGEEVEKVKRATEIVKELDRDILVEGPIQYDAAIEPSVAKKKLPNSEVAGRASVFIFPDLNTGNNTYKAVQRSSNAVAIGPILQGLNKPVNDLSRGCLVADIVNTVAITAIQAQGN